MNNPATVPLGIPLPDTLAKVDPFDYDLLPDVFRPFIEDIADRMQCPRDYPAVGVMTALAAAISRRLGVLPKQHDNWSVVPNLWGLVVGPPSMLKTPSQQLAIAPLQRRDREAAQLHEQQTVDFEKDEVYRQITAKQRKAELQDAIKRGAHDEVRFIRNELATVPEPPKRQRIIITDATMEVIGEIMRDYPYGLLMKRDEIVGLLRGMDRPGRESERAFLNEAWDGKQGFTWDRIGRGTIEVPATCLSILGAATPGGLSSYIRDAVSNGAGADGLLQRFQLVVWPDVPAGWRNIDRRPDSTAIESVNLLFERLVALPEVTGNFETVCDIPCLRFDAEAAEVFLEWRGYLEARLRLSDDHEAFLSHLGKYRSLVPSLALLIYVADNQISATSAVNATSVQKAIAWAGYLESHAQRLYSPALRREVHAARSLLTKLENRKLEPEFTARDVYRHGWSGLSETEQVFDAIQVLMDFDWLTAEEQPTGRKPKIVYRYVGQ